MATLRRIARMACLACVALVPAAGCSDSNTVVPDGSMDGSSDGDMDAPLDAPADAPGDADGTDAGDGGTDAGCADPAAESCNTLDDDCDGTVDEGIGAEIGCDPGEGCIDGSCGCPPERMCGARCIDTSSDPEHCGSCGNACAEGDLCAGGSCCTPTGPETCNGSDDDCDGDVDEGSGETVGCSEGQLCVDGSCSCPSDRMCGSSCVDVTSDPDHCGSCGNACGGGEVCAGGECCTEMGLEDCNGEDDDCDGDVDEGTPAALGCAEGQLCLGGSCTCPSSHTCGDECVNTATDPDHCGSCGNACDADEVCDSAACCVPTSNPVDVLFVVDNSNSMAEEQVSLANAFPDFIDILTSGDLDGDGTTDFPQITDLHVGVVTADMGTGGHSVPTCAPYDFGDDGILRTEGNTNVSGCSATYPSVLSYSPGDSTSALAQDFSCVARVGTGGCGFEQQLEAALKALTPSTSPITFVSGTRGHGDGANAGFLRSDSLLGLVLLTDEDDCSAADPGLYDPDSPTYTGDLNLRCFQFPGALHVINRYVDGFRALRQDASSLVFSAITGVPPDLVSDPSSIDYTAILNDSRMTKMIDPSNPSMLAPSCSVSGRGRASPPRRIVRTARDLEANGAASVVQSICQSDYGPALEAVAQQLAAGVVASCD